MKPRLILPGALALAAMWVPTMATAQEVGIAGGWNTATLVFDPAQDRLRGPDHRPGFLVGAFIRSPLHRRADVRAEFFVSQKGVKQLFRLGDELVLTDFEVPVLIQVNLHQPDASGVHLFAGRRSPLPWQPRITTRARPRMRSTIWTGRRMSG
jgi:hypothetical protein